MKKILSMLLATTIVLGSFVLSVSNVKFVDFTLKASAESATSGSCGENATWSYNETTKTLTISGTGEMDDYEELAAYTYPWRFSEDAENIVIENGITNIGEYAFAGFEVLKNVTIANTVTGISDSSFRYCTSLESITLPDSVTSIDSGAFSNCKSLKNINISDNIIDISAGAFYNTSYFNNESNWENDALYIKQILIAGKDTIKGSYKIKDGTKVISSYAFSGNESITDISVPKSVISIGNRVFRWCSSLANISVDAANPNYTSVDGVLFNKAKTEIICYPAGTKASNYTIPNSVTSISVCAFGFCQNLTNITIPNGVTSIGDDAFENSQNLTDITIPNSVTNIGSSAFWGCSALESITIPNSVISVDDYAFYDCSALKSVTISDSVTSIGLAAFNSNESLSDVYYTGSEEEWNSISIAEGNHSLLNATIHFEEDNSSSPSEPDEPTPPSSDDTESPSESEGFDYMKLLEAVYEAINTMIVPVAVSLITIVFDLILMLIQ